MSTPSPPPSRRGPIQPSSSAPSPGPPSRDGTGSAPTGNPFLGGQPGGTDSEPTGNPFLGGQPGGTDSAPTGNPFLGGQPAAKAPSADQPSTASTWLAIGLSVVMNLISLIGVINFGWPPGNVFALFWIENVIIGFWGALKVATARDGGSPIGTALFFCFHYGLFCLVHGVFTAVIVFRIGFEPSFWWLGFPAILIMIRYAVETVTTWFGRGAQRDRLSPKQAMIIPYPRIIVLHIAILFSFGMTSDSGDLHDVAQGIQDFLQPILSKLSGATNSEGVSMVLILIVIKTAVDIATTRRAVTR